MSHLNGSTADVTTFLPTTRNVGSEEATIDHDSKRDLIFASDGTNILVRRPTGHFLVQFDAVYVVDMAFDWVNDNLYWIEREDTNIHVANIFTKHTKTLVNNWSASEIVVDPRRGQGWMYSIHGNGRIEKRSMDAAGSTHSILSSSSSDPRGITIGAFRF